MMSPDHPQPPRTGPAWSGSTSRTEGRGPRADRAIFLICWRWGRVNMGGRPPEYLGYSDSNPSSLKLLITSRTRSGLVKAPWRSAPRPCRGRTAVPSAPASTSPPTQQAVALLVRDLPNPQGLTGHGTSCPRPLRRDQRARPSRPSGGSTSQVSLTRTYGGNASEGTSRRSGSIASIGRTTEQQVWDPTDASCPATC